MSKAIKTFHLIANAHLDPVWLWDWREGLNEGIITSRTILNLMDEIKDLTCIRGEAAIYQYIERFGPPTFRRIRRYVDQERWDVVGGTYIQPDMNLPATETLLRHFVRSKRYFKERFGKEVKVAWAADAFGHSAGLPEILASAGIKGFAFSRPFISQLPLAKPAFWWIGTGGSRVMGYRPLVGCYGSERYMDIGAHLDEFLKAASKSDLDNVGVYYGLGNHGGGPTRRLVEEIHKWADRHPEVKVVHSGLHRLFEALYGEIQRKGDNFLPIYKGELNFCQRGCYASVAKFKFAYRKTEALLTQTERTAAVIHASLKKPAADLSAAWDGLLFNTFHDILPGSSIERAYEDQLAWLGGARHQCRETEIIALNALAGQVDTRVPPVKDDHPSAVAFLVWNPHPYEYIGPLELEACLDYRPIPAYTDRADKLPVVIRGPDGKPLTIQKVATEHASFPNLAWRKRAVFPAKLPPLGWSVFTFGWEEDVKTPKIADEASAPAAGTIENLFYRVTARKGNGGIKVWYKNAPVFGREGMTFITVDDPWGSWGGEQDEPDSLNLSTVRYRWKITDVKILERGPIRAALWVKMEGGKSRVEQIISLFGGRDAVDGSARMLWNERAARLKMVMPVGGTKADFEVPGGVVRRGPLGEVPGGRWVRVSQNGKSFSFASDALYAFDCKQGSLRATVCRASRYADNCVKGAKEETWRPAVDAGELQFRYGISCGKKNPWRLAGELEQPPTAFLTSPHSGRLPRTGSFAALTPATIRLLALKPAEDGRGWILRVQNSDGKTISAASLYWMGKQYSLGRIPPWQITTWRLMNIGKKWRFNQSSVLEK